MKVELTIDRTKKLPDGAMPALEKELLKRLRNQFEDCSLVVRRAGSDGLSVY
nr:DinI-like family protein [Enterobacter hormaechei]